MLRFATAPEYREPEDTYWTFNYFKDKVLGEKNTKSVPMGAHNVQGTL
jgi:hypothetical protein